MTAKPQDHLSKTHSFEHNGKSYTIPSLKSLPMGAVRKARKTNDEAEKVFIILESVLDEDSAELKAVDSMNADEFQSFLEGWTQGASVGESVSSES